MTARHSIAWSPGSSPRAAIRRAQAQASAGYTVPLEPSEEPFVRGIVGMARSQDPNSAGSQWFFTLGDAPHLNGQYTVFGKVVQGMELLDCIGQDDAIISLVIQEL